MRKLKLISDIAKSYVDTYQVNDSFKSLMKLEGKEVELKYAYKLAGLLEECSNDQGQMKN